MSVKVVKVVNFGHRDFPIHNRTTLKTITLQLWKFQIELVLFIAKEAH